MITFCYNDHSEAKNEVEDFIIDNIEDGIIVTGYFECDTCLIVNFGLEEGFNDIELEEFFSNISGKLKVTEFEFICHTCVDCEDKSIVFDYKEED